MFGYNNSHNNNGHHGCFRITNNNYDQLLVNKTPTNQQTRNCLVPALTYCLLSFIVVIVLVLGHGLVLVRALVLTLVLHPALILVLVLALVLGLVSLLLTLASVLALAVDGSCFS